MGIRGLTTLLSDDRRRFGEPWSLTPPPPEGEGGGNAVGRRKSSRTAVYIDGPALLYHLLSAPVDGGDSGPFRRDRSIPPPRYREPRSLCGRASPAAVHRRASSFASALREAGADEVHLVSDGVAPALKDGARAERMREACATADGIARRVIDGRDGGGGGGGSSGVVPHPFAEQAMVEAFEDLAGAEEEGAGDGKKVYRVHRAHGEAEGFIAQLISSRSGDENGGDDEDEWDAVVLSNDTDLLVYPSMKGFVPLRSLQFGRDSSPPDGCASVSGWRFLRSKLLAAYGLPPGLSGMAAAAAIAGCDYELPPRHRARLNSARAIVVRSDVGGLRRKERNDPPARATAVAALRFVGHFAGRARGGGGGDSAKGRRVGPKEGGGEDEDAWLRRLALAATEGGGGREDREDRAAELAEAMRMVRDVYERDSAAGVDSRASGKMAPDADVRRLLERGIFHCPPVIETWDRSLWGSVRGRKEAKRKGRKAMGSGHTAGADEDGDEDESRGGGSVWASRNFVEVRRRMYSVLSLLSGPRSALRTVPVAEFRRVGVGRQIDYKAVAVDVRVGTGNADLDEVLRGDARDDVGGAFCSALDYCLRGVHRGAREDGASAATAPGSGTDLRRALEDAPPSLRGVLVAGMMLPARDALILFISASVPSPPPLPPSPSPTPDLGGPMGPDRRQQRWSPSHRNADNSSPGKFLASANAVAAACLHARVLIGALSELLGPGGRARPGDGEFFVGVPRSALRAEAAFRDDIARAAWDSLADRGGGGAARSDGGDEGAGSGIDGFEGEAEGLGSDGEGWFDEVFGGVLRGMLREETLEIAETENERSEWRSSALALWRQWRLYNSAMR